MSEGPALLEVRGLCSGFDAGPVLFDVDLEVGAGEMVAVIGSNGAGKSTLLGTLSGLVPATGGQITLEGKQLTSSSPQQRLGAGVVHVPQGRRLFAGLSVERNLMLGAYLRHDPDVKADLARILDHFPALKDKLKRDAATLSGGEQQMVAIARGLMSRPKLLMVDELSLGLAPNIAERLIGVLGGMTRAEGISMIVVEQDVVLALEVADRAYVLENGRVALSGTSASLSDNPQVKQAYLGI